MSGTHYVAGFLFNEAGSLVALIEKNKPDWQLGKLNGIGGKIEPGELAEDAMIREFREETGIEVTSWRYFCRLSSRDFSWTVHFFVARLPGAGAIPLAPDAIRSPEGPISLFFADSVLFATELTIPNLRWLIPLALDADAPFAAVREMAPAEQSK